MKRMKTIFATVAIAALPLAVIPVMRWYNQEFARIPEKQMVINMRDTKAGRVLEWENKGVATLVSPEFKIAFEGYSFFPDGLLNSGGGYRIDGRYGGMFGGPDSAPSHRKENNGVTFEYSARVRELSITYKNHRVVYSDYRRVLKVNDKKYSTAAGPVLLLVSKNGQVKQLRF